MITLNDLLPFSITSSKGKQQYYDHLEYYKEYGNSGPVKRKLPSEEEIFEYLDLLKEERQGKRWELINYWRSLRKFTNFYDWRDIVTISPDGLEN